MAASRCVRATCVLILLLMGGLSFASPAAGISAVGFRGIRVHDPVNSGIMPGYVFYPTATPSHVTWIGPYKLHATAKAAPLPGRKPLVVISHGHGGSDLGHHDLAVYLASHGFVTATLQQPRDNYLDDSGNGKPAVMIGRPIQIKATIDMLLGNPLWKPLLDPDRIGVAGFSNGGYTALMVVGAEPDFTRILSYCKARPQDSSICGLERKLKAVAARRGRSIKQYLTTMQNDMHRWGNPGDPRVKAVFVMAPFSLVFDKAGLASIKRPVFLYYGQDDPVLIPKYNVLHIAPLIKTLAGIKMIPKAGHYVFLSPCSKTLAKEAPDICQDPQGVNRVAVHRKINAMALSFFRKVLDISPTP